MRGVRLGGFDWSVMIQKVPLAQNKTFEENALKARKVRGRCRSGRPRWWGGAFSCKLPSLKLTAETRENWCWVNFDHVCILWAAHVLYVLILFETTMMDNWWLDLSNTNTNQALADLLRFIVLYWFTIMSCNTLYYTCLSNCLSLTECAITYYYITFYRTFHTSRIAWYNYLERERQRFKYWYHKEQWLHNQILGEKKVRFSWSRRCYISPHGKHQLPAGKPTWQWKSTFFNKKYIFNTSSNGGISTANCYANLPECNVCVCVWK